MIDLKPFTRMYTFYPYSDEKLREMVSRVSKAHHWAEYETVKRGYRKATVWHVYTRNYDKEVERIFRDKLVWIPILRSKSYEGFSHKHFITDKIDLDTFTYGALARTVEEAEEMVKAHKGQGTDHAKIGELLGYPSCCVNFFCKVWDAGIYDPVFEIALNTDEKEVRSSREVVVYGHPYLNQATRYVGLRVVPWFPCSYNCEESIRLGEEVWAKIMREYDDEAFDWYMELLKEGIRWDSLYGIAEITIGDKIKIVTNTYPYYERRILVYKVK
ncbi:DUF483 domain-containing protein [Candidatus Bathyarchaeota archaeon]|nr:DUF483 domain-containing protein [Candidatus Bathyarchaeota archaeon]